MTPPPEQAEAFYIEDEDGETLISQAEDLDQARYAARYAVLEGWPAVVILAHGNPLPLERFRLDEWRNVVVQTSDLVRRYDPRRRLA